MHDIFTEFFYDDDVSGYVVHFANYCYLKSFVQGEPNVVLTDVEYLVNKKENSGIIILSSLHSLCLWKFNE